MAVGPLLRSATIKGGQVGAREPTFTVATVPPQTLTIKTDQEALKRGDWLTSPPTLIIDRHPMTPTVTDAMSSSSSAQGTPS
jgi:hypothetical protein